MTLKKANINWDSLGFDLVQTRSMYSQCILEKLGKGVIDSLWEYRIISRCCCLKLWAGVFEGTSIQTLDGRVVLFRIDKNAEDYWSRERLLYLK